MHYIWNWTLYRSRLIVAYQSGQALALVAYLATKLGGFMESFPMFLSNLLSRMKKNSYKNMGLVFPNVSYMKYDNYQLCYQNW